MAGQHRSCDSCACEHLSKPDRRRFTALLTKAALLLPFGMLAPSLGWTRSRYSVTIASLQKASATELGAHRRYVVYARKAKADGYTGIAYLFSTLATSELIHAQNYNRLLVLLGAEVVRHDSAEVLVASTKENLIYAANRELNSIKNTYPGILKEIEGEGFEDARVNVNYAWKSHKQHLDIINKIRRWSPRHFETVARRIDKATDHYFVCQICGSTVKELPEEVCPVCDYPIRHYRLIDPDLYAQQ